MPSFLLGFKRLWRCGCEEAVIAAFAHVVLGCVMHMDCFQLRQHAHLRAYETPFEEDCSPDFWHVWQQVAHEAGEKRPPNPEGVRKG